MMRRVMAYIGPVLVGPYLVGRFLHRVLVGWWLGPILQKAANGRLYKDIQVEMPFLFAKCQSMSKGGRSLPSGSAEVMLVCSELCIRIARVQDEIFAGAGRCGKERIINLMVVIQALMALEMPARLDGLLTLESVDDIFRAHWDEIVAGFCEPAYELFIAKIDCILKEQEIVTRQVEWELNRSLASRRNSPR